MFLYVGVHLEMIDSVVQSFKLLNVAENSQRTSNYAEKSRKVQPRRAHTPCDGTFAASLICSTSFTSFRVRRRFNKLQEFARGLLVELQRD